MVEAIICRERRARGPCHPGNMYTVIQVNNNEFMIASRCKVTTFTFTCMVEAIMQGEGGALPSHRGNTYTVIQVKNNEFSIVGVK